jgi:signal recognition particle subunit SRP68
VTSSDADESVYVKARAATLPPTMAAVPVKPIFFDLALNHIDYDRETIARRAGKRVGSLGGLFGGLWGRR